MHVRRIRRVSGLLFLLAGAVAIGSIASVSAGGGHCRTQAITDGSDVRVEVTGFCYEPTVLRVDAGQTVEWTNRDEAPHTVTGVNNAWGDFTQFGEDESISFSFPTEGVFPYFCALHPGMLGTVVVGDSGEVPGLEVAGSEATTVAPADDAMRFVWLARVVLISLAAGAFLGVVRRS